MNTESLSASARKPAGKGAARKARRAGKLPGVVYRGGQDALSIEFDPAELNRIFRQTKNPNTLIELDVDGDVRVCLVKDVQRHPVTKVARHVDFYQVDLDVPVQVNVPVHTTGIAAGIKLGGSLRLIHRTLDVTCKPADIPAAVTIDVSHMEINDIVKISEVPTPPGCTVASLTDFNVLTIIGKRAEEIEEELEGEGEGEEEEEGEEEDED